MSFWGGGDDSHTTWDFYEEIAELKSQVRDLTWQRDELLEALEEAEFALRLRRLQPEVPTPDKLIDRVADTFMDIVEQVRGSKGEPLE